MYVLVVTTLITQIFGNCLFLVSSDELSCMVLQVWHLSLNIPLTNSLFWFSFWPLHLWSKVVHDWEATCCIMCFKMCSCISWPEFYGIWKYSTFWKIYVSVWSVTELWNFCLIFLFNLVLISVPIVLCNLLYFLIFLCFCYDDKESSCIIRVRNL
jgi:hypothetical protein